MIHEAQGDLEIALGRISDGQAEQWGNVKPKKKLTPTIISTPSSRGAYADRGARGVRGAPRGARGSSMRGGRGGGIQAQPRAPYSNGESTPASFVSTPPPILPSTPALVAPTWGAKPVLKQVTEDWAPVTEVSTPATTGWGQESSPTNGSEERSVAPATPDAGWGGESTPATVAAPKARVATKTIAPGSKVSWASIARSVPPLLLFKGSERKVRSRTHTKKDPSRRPSLLLPLPRLSLSFPCPLLPHLKSSSNQ